MLTKFKKSILLFSTVFSLLILEACNLQTEEPKRQIQEVNERSNRLEYLGRNLEIAVLGSPPKVNTDKVTFTSVDIEKLSIQTAEEYDGFFVMEEYLERAADGPYTKVFANSNVPFFFIGTEASYLPFVDDEVSYEDYAKRIHNEEIFAQGYYPGAERGALGWSFSILVKDVTEKEYSEFARELYYEMFKIIGDLNTL
ncbi:putative lipoprotein [Planococcus donghaensis MPA1U2]|uniref:Putative lipoprotein n=1 Tax=Planococcus donghaensis MPA1U2 TaxID=933115 RepID=E7RED7_9BACL|nr:hypothetical protein [Planococcus donghaensis]EGA90518.1 putative lipoprotein [Planococcus donghaensis MPA1U2]